MPHFLKKRPFLILIIFSVLIIAAAIYTGMQGNRLTFVEGLVGEFITPIQGVMYRIATSTTNFFESIKARRSLEEDYARLKERVSQLEKQQLEMDEIIRENERLKALLDFKRDKEEFVLSGARVTGKNPGYWFNVITINKGTDDGVMVDMAVITDQGLIGRVIDTGKNWAKVRTIVDGQSSISAIIQRTRDNGMVNGNNTLTFEDGLCTMTDLPLNSDVAPGDKVITSGLGGILPKGIYIGEVVEVISERRDMYITAIVKPGADFQRLEEVMVVSQVNE